MFFPFEGWMIIEKTVENKAQEKIERIKTSLEQNLTNTSSNISSINISISEIVSVSTNLSKLLTP